MIPDTHALGQPEPPISNARLAMLLFVASEAMLFTGLITGYVVLGFGSSGFSGMPTLPLGLAPLAVAILVASSCALVLSRRAIKAEGSRAMSDETSSATPAGSYNGASVVETPARSYSGAWVGSTPRASASARWSLIALVLGTIFLAVQAIEWTSMLSSGMLPGSAVNAGMLYVVGGVHGLHVVVGLVFLAVLAVRALRDPTAASTRSSSTVTALYWHFVTIVWITLFLMLYIL